MKEPSAGGTTIGSLLLYVGIGIAVAAYAVLSGIHAARTGESGELPLRWLSLFLTTAIMFWVVVKQYRRDWHHFSFWLKVAGLLTVHLLVFTVVLYEIPEWRIVWFIPIAVIEGGMLVLILDKLVRPSA